MMKPHHEMPAVHKDKTSLEKHEGVMIELKDTELKGDSGDDEFERF
jgi:hypothetical protein